MAQDGIRLGVDIGGTFTDVVLEGPDLFASTKVLTTYAAPEDAIVEGLQRVCAAEGIPPSAITQIIHGTTLATNALIERRGARTALITTEGFRDVIEMRSESRFEQYDLNLTLPDPLLPRQRRLCVRERVNARSEIMIALDEAEVATRINEIAAMDVDSVAVGLMHSYLNPAHERRIREMIAARLPNVSVSISSEVSPQMREYERFNTTVANAYIKPLIASYLGRLEARLKAEGVTADVFLMHSGGGIISLQNAADFPVRLVESGPAGGAVFAADIAARHGLDKVLSFDMGGTTAKICLIKDQTPKTARVFEVARTYRFKKGSGMPISIPVIDMVEIGAGGGSLASVDALQRIAVGPESAGSEPGPASYGRGGNRPAVTDADLVLGKLDPAAFAGGRITLDHAAAARALDTAVGTPLGMAAPQEAAFGVTEVVDENMANAARVHAVENGEDLSDYTMIAFGGAAPLHAGRLCEKLGISRCLVPPGAGVGSAIGFLRAPFSFEATRSVYMRLSAFDAESVAQLLTELADEATAFVRTCDATAPIETAIKVYMRYAGQGWEIPVTLTPTQAATPDAATFVARFEEDYAQLFGRTVAGLDIEVTVWSVNASTPKSTSLPMPERAAQTTLVSHQATRQIFDPARATTLEAVEIARRALASAMTCPGPAAIVEEETTIIVPASRTALCHADGCIELSLEGAQS